MLEKGRSLASDRHGLCFREYSVADKKCLVKRHNVENECFSHEGVFE